MRRSAQLPRAPPQGASISFPEYVLDHYDRLLELSLEHLAVVLAGLLVGSVVGLALGMAVHRTPRARSAAVHVCGLILTVPSLAMYALLLALLGTIGTLPVIVALALYSLLPIVRNTVTGLNGVDPAVVEAAQGVGMGRWRRLVSIELPLAWPVVVTGVRVSAVLLVGVAALGPIIGGPGLGELIFSGLRVITSPNAVNLALMGTLGVVLVGMLLDGAFLVLTRVTTSRGVR
ncbi:ABC transporter permease [Pseudonocardia xinjiangensis]|uniref:ABC transporter permease n=1 Tax=Pseudonocardia xinjiangensis TaxID=75289 RepID=UPI003D93221C